MDTGGVLGHGEGPWDIAGGILGHRVLGYGKASWDMRKAQGHGGFWDMGGPRTWGGVQGHGGGHPETLKFQGKPVREGTACWVGRSGRV